MPIRNDDPCHAATDSAFPVTAMRAALPPPPRPVYATRHSLGVLPSERGVDWEIATDMDAVRRYSVPTSATSSYLLTTTTLVPESILMVTDLAIAGVAPQREGHCVYLLEIDSGEFGTHVIDKRYSEIRAFRHELRQLLRKSTTKNTACHGSHGPCAQLVRLAQIPFPRRRLRLPLPRHPATTRDADVALAAQRLPVLERFLQAMLRVFRMASRREMRACNNSRCVVVDTIKRFLDVAEPVLYLEHDQQNAGRRSVAINMTRPQTSDGPERDVATRDEKELFCIAEDREALAAH